MIFTAIRIANFRSFRGEQEFVFPQEPGLYFMTGVNKVEPRLGGNAAGKSTIWDALCWCLFGKTPTGLKAGAVNSWGTGKGTAVSVDFVSGSGEECTVTRTWGPITWRLTWKHGDRVEDLAKAEDNPVLGWLGFDYSTFLYAALMAQDQDMFLDQKADVQAAVFGEVMNLDVWLGHSAKASAKAQAQDAVTRGLERKQSELQGRLEAARHNDFAERAAAWDKERAQRLDDLEVDYKAALGKHALLKAEVAKTAQEESAALARADGIADTMRAPAEALREAERVLNTKTAHTESLLRTLEAAERAEKDIREGRPCPTCGQVQGPGVHGFSSQKAAVGEVNRLTEELARMTELTADYLESVKKMRARVDGLRDAEDRALADLEDAGARRLSAARALQFSDRDLDRMEDTAERITDEANPFAALARDNDLNLARLAEDLEGVQRELDDSRHQHSVYTYLIKGFKEIRLQQIAEALSELEVEVNSCCAALGLTDWELNFAVDRENKGGGISRGFSVTVRSPHNKEPVPWESWSGGEKQRLRIAGNMGLADLVRGRTGAALPLEIWDEPTKNLTPEGVQDLLETLEHRARHEQRQIWLVDHNTHNFGGFAGNAVITKGTRGSRIAQA